MQIKMNKEQRDFVLKYQDIYDRLTYLEEMMQQIQVESQSLIKELETLREEERKKFNIED